jgi:ubiquinone/menaquinone biosynthesis C-methylase UbiE
MVGDEALARGETLFDNPFRIEDLLIFDDNTLRKMLTQGSFGLCVELLARGLQGVPGPLVRRIKRNLPPAQRELFMQQLRHPVANCERERARRQILDALFWELTYWKTPGLYEELTEGEDLHPGIFQRLAPDLERKAVLDAGAGSGRASFECVRRGAALVYAVEPSPGLLRLLEQKVAQRVEGERIIPLVGRFEALPLADNSVDVALSCSAFTSAPEQGGEPGLAEMRRVTRPGGKIVLIWPRPQDNAWLLAHGFHYVTLPMHQEMCVHFRSLKSALRCVRRFYAHNRAAVRYILTKQRADVPFTVLGINPPHDYCWLEVMKS